MVSRVINLVLVTVVVLTYGAAAARGGSGQRYWRWGWDPLIRSPVDAKQEVDDEMTNGTRWAVLVAGSNGYGNYRHQVSV